MSNDPLLSLRQQINTLDDQLIALLAERYALLADVVKVKAEHNIPHVVPARVEEVLRRNAENGAERGLPPEHVRALWTVIIDAAHQYEETALKNCRS
jgi:chorismate mutase